MLDFISLSIGILYEIRKNFFSFFPILFSHKSGRANDTIEQIDEDIAVTRSQMNFICPITQVCIPATVIDRETVISHWFVYYESAVPVKQQYI